MIDAGFSAVFVGIETPDPAALEEAGKRQNLRVDPAEAVRRLTSAGLEVFAGFIVGFDADDADTFERQRAFIQGLPIPRAMVGTLTALPGTALWRRLEREGRLRTEATGDQFDRTNFEPAMGEEPLLSGYRRLLAELYDEDAYFRRCALHLDAAPARPAPLRKGSLATLARTLWRLGIRGPRRRHFWRLVGHALRARPGGDPARGDARGARRAPPPLHARGGAPAPRSAARGPAGRGRRRARPRRGVPLLFVGARYPAQPGGNAGFSTSSSRGAEPPPMRQFGPEVETTRLPRTPTPCSAFIARPPARPCAPARART